MMDVIPYYSSHSPDRPFGPKGKHSQRARNEHSHLNFEHLLELTGGFGPFQCFILVALLSTEIPAAFVAFAPVFVGKPPEDYVCVVENQTIISTSSNQICDCNGTLSLLDGSTTINTEWNLFCGASFVSDFITSIQMLGMLLGSLFTSQFSDWYGRKRTYLMVCMIMAIGQALSAAAPSPWFYALARFFCGAGLSGFMGMSTIYPMEFLTTKWRHLCGSVGPWGEGIMMLALLANYWRMWRNFLWITCIPFILVLVLYPFIPESPRWLLRNKRHAEAHKILENIYHTNGKHKTSPGFPITMELLEKVSIEESKGMRKSKFTYLDFFRNPELRWKTLFLMGIWFSWSLVYFGISYNVKNVRGNLYLNVGLLGLADALGYPGALLINNRLGRRKTLIVCMGIGTIFLVSLAGWDLAFGSSLSPLVVAILCLLGKFGVAGARSAARCLTGESFPTPIRTMGYGISGITAGVGGIIAPQLAYFGEQCWHPLPFLTFAVISISGSAISLLLPETADQSLQEAFRDNSGNPQGRKNGSDIIDSYVIITSSK